MTITEPFCQDLSLPLRPDEGGKRGKPIQVTTNFYPVASLPKRPIMHYDVEIRPNVPPKVIHRVFQACIDQHWQSSSSSARVVHDGRANAFSTQNLLPPNSKIHIFDVVLQSIAGSRARQESFKVILRLVNSFDATQLERFLHLKGSLTDVAIIQSLDILVRYDAQRNFIYDGKSIFISPNSVPLPGGLLVRQGLYQSVRPAQGKMLLLCDIASRAFYAPGPLLDVVPRVIGFPPHRPWKGEFRSTDLPGLDRFLRTIRIHVTHRGPDLKPRHSLQGITRSPAHSTFFTKEDGTKVSVVQYFHEQYNVRILYPGLPCVRTAKGDFFPMDVCVIEPGQVYRRKLNPDQTSEMIKAAAVKPHQRQRIIQDGINLLRHNANPDLQAFGVRIGTQPVIAQARILPPPTIEYDAASKGSRFAPINGSWNLRDKRVLKGVTLRKWMVMTFASPRDINPQQIKHFVRELLVVLVASGISVDPAARNPQILPPIVPQNTQSLGNAIRSAYLMANPRHRDEGGQPQFVMCLLRDKSIPIYSEIKRVFEIELGLPTQCCLYRHVIKPNKQYCANVGLKINQKLGGVNHDLVRGPQAATASFYTSAPTLVVGADVIHPDPGPSRQPSIAALASSNSLTPVRFYATASAQKGRMEIIADLEAMMVESLKAFYRSTRSKPSRILFFRDGVGEGMFEEVLRSEIPAIKKACASLQPGYNPQLMLIVVQKRHHVRFFPQGGPRGGFADRSGNCLPGTTVDRIITHPSQYDFYVQSHAGLQGTSRPTHYHVLHDEIKMGSDTLQGLVNDMCYLYGRATRSVRIVPAVYYADQIAARAKAHYGTEGDGWSEAGSDTGSVSSSMAAEVSPLAKLPEKLRGAMYFT